MNRPNATQHGSRTSWCRLLFCRYPSAESPHASYRSPIPPFVPATKRISLEFPNGRICIRSRRSRDVSDCRRQCGGGRVVFGRLPHLSWSLPDSLSPSPSLSVKTRFQRVSTISLTHSIPFPPSSPLFTALLPFPICIPSPTERERKRAFLLLNCFSLSLWPVRRSLARSLCPKRP